MPSIDYQPSPTCELFHADGTSFVRGLMGPIGSGKSVACAMDLLYRARMQQPDQDGVRPTKFLVVRNTYQMLQTTTIATWKDWFGPICSIKMGSPIVSTIDLPQEDGTRVHMETQFLALDRPDDTAKIKSLELTGVWLNEAKEMPKGILKDASSRVGRFPAKRRCPITWSGLIMDTNPPDDDHWYYNLAEVEKPEGYAFFKQPGALILKDGRWIVNPDAENVQHQPLGYTYWTRQLPGADREWIKAYLGGMYASVFDGRPVYEHAWNDALHTSETSLPVMRGLPIVVGVDFGLTPAAVVLQLLPSGELNVLREYCFERGGIRQFANDVLKPALFAQFNGMHYIFSCDPAGTAGQQADSDVSCIGELQKLGLPAKPAVTNKFQLRREAVLNFLNRVTANGPAFRLDPSCRMLRKGFNGGYKLNRVQIAGEERYKDEPDKNRYSHIHDALQYACLVADPTTSPTRNRGQARTQKNTMAGLT